MKETTLPIVGEKFGYLQVKEFSRYYKRSTFWYCQCVCGKIIEINQKDLYSGKIQSCGCIDCKNEEIEVNGKTKGVSYIKSKGFWRVSINYKQIRYPIGIYDNENDAVIARKNAEEIIQKIRKHDRLNVVPKPKKPKVDFVGKTFGKLTVVSLESMGKHTIWHCKCVCGNEKNIYQHNLTNGKTTSCGCEKKRILEIVSREKLHIYKGIQIEKAIAKNTPRNNTSGFRGVFIDKKSGKYRARMILQGVRHELGYFNEFQDAVIARLKAEEKRDAIVEEYKSLVEDKNKKVLSDYMKNV